MLKYCENEGIKDSNIKLGNVDEEGKSINDVEKAMNRIGIAIRSSKGEFKDFDVVLQEFVNKYKEGKLSEVDFMAGINTLGGTRQKETLLALVENFDKAKEHMNDLTNSTGSAKQMYDVYSQSLEARISDLKRAFEGLYEKIMSSDSLKWLVTEFTQLITALSNVDGKTILFTASIGGLVLVMSKLSALNKALITGEAVTGLSKFIAVLSGMSTVEKAIEETTNATRAMQLAQVGLTEAEVAGTVGATGLSGAFTLLSNGIKGAITSSLAFMATPLGLVITAIGTAIGIAIAGFVAYKQHQAELVQTSKDLKTAIEGVNSALKSGDTKGASQSLDKVRDEQKALEDLIKKRKEMQALPEDSFYGKMGGATKAQSIDQITYKINEQIKVIKDAGLSVEETTGKINELQSAEQQIVNQNIVDKIKAETQAQVEHRTNTEANTEEYKKYISTVQNLYSEYQNLSSQENLSAEQKTQLASVVQELQGKVGNLDVQMDENGKTYITNTQLISDTISYLNSEGETVETLINIKLADQKSNASWQYNNTSITYSETIKRIADYNAEIAKIKQLMQARMLATSATILDSKTKEDDNSDDYNNLRNESRMRSANGANQQEINSLTDDISALQAGADAIDKLYTTNIPLQSAGGGGVPDSGNYTPSGGDDKKAKQAEDKAQKLKEEIDALKSDIEPDRYLDFNNAIKNVDSELTLNKTLQDSLKEGSTEYQQAQQQEIDLYKQKQTALANLNDEQKKESDELKTKLASMSFEFDENGKLINSQQRLLEIQKSINDETGDTEEAKKQKENDIKWLKDLQKETENYTSLVGDKIPKTTDEWQQQANAIAKVVEEAKKANLDILNNAKEELAQDILKDAQAQVDALKAEATQAEEDAKQALESEKTSELALWDEKIKSKQAELDRLNDESSNNEEKLKKVQDELALWKKENDNPFAKSKIESLTTQQDELIKTITKDNLSKEITSLNDQKQAESDSYDKQLTALEKANKEQEAEDELHYKDLLDEKKAYAKAEKMINKNQRSDMYDLYSKYSEEYKKMGGDLSTSVEASLKKITDAITALNNAKINNNGDSSIHYTGTSSSGSNYAVVDGGLVADKPFDTNEASSIYDSSRSSNSSSSSSSKSKTYSNGDYEDSNGYYHSSSSSNTYYDADSGTYKKLAQYATGGRTPDNLESNGGLAIVDAKEKILNQEETKDWSSAVNKINNMSDSMLKIDEIYNHVKIADATIMQLSNMVNSPNNYSMPSALSQIDLNKLANSVTNSNTDNSITQPVEMSVSIVNHNGAEAVMNEKSLEKMVNKVIQKSATKYGGKSINKL